MKRVPRSYDGVSAVVNTEKKPHNINEWLFYERSRAHSSTSSHMLICLAARLFVQIALGVTYACDYMVECNFSLVHILQISDISRARGVNVEVSFLYVFIWLRVCAGNLYAFCIKRTASVGAIFELCEDKINEKTVLNVGR